MRFEDLTYLQRIRIVQQPIDCCENTYVLDILNDDEIWEEIEKHPDWVNAAKYPDDPYMWKDMMNEAEWDVKAKWALSIYNAVKEVLEQGDKLT